MRRTAIAVATVALVSFFASVPAGAQSPAAGGTLKSGVPKAGSVTTPDGIEYTFSAVAGSHVTVTISNAKTAHSGCLQLGASQDNNAWGPVDFSTTSPSADLDFTLQYNDTVRVVVSGCDDDGATGKFTITYS